MEFTEKQLFALCISYLITIMNECGRLGDGCLMALFFSPVKLILNS